MVEKGTETAGGGLRVAVAGEGFWAPYQIAAWREADPTARIVSIYNRDRSKAEAVAARFAIPAVYASVAEMLRAERPDVLDIITSPETHPAFTRAAAGQGIAVICQKPMANTLAEAEQMAAACRAANVPLFIHENWRWQRPMRAVKELLASRSIGQVFRARVSFITGFPVFANQPFLKTLPQFILTDIGTHILDAARFLFGEALNLYCQTRKVHNDIAGEDVATVMMSMGEDATTVTCEMAYAENAIERDAFPQTFLFIEGSDGSIEVGPDYWVKLTTRTGTHAKRHPPPRYEWSHPAYDLVMASMVPCIENLAAALRGTGAAETSGDDNLKTLKLVFAAYDSAERHAVVRV